MGRKILTIDVSRPIAEISDDLVSAARDTGFWYIKGHGIDQHELEAMLKAGRELLDLPTQVKKKYPFNPDTYLGHRGPDELINVTGNRLWEWFSLGHYGLGGFDVKSQSFKGDAWPKEVDEEWRRTVLAFQQKIHAVAVKLLKAIFIGLGRDASIIDEAFDMSSEENPSFVAWNYYPPMTDEDLANRAAGKLPPRLHAHADMDILTLLYNPEGDVGLEIAPGNDVEDLSLIEDVGNAWNSIPQAREWTALGPKPGHFTVNIGDGLTRWTDGLLKSTYHRVRAPRDGDPTGPRWSIPYFVNPKLNFVIQGPEKRWGPVTGFDLLSKTGNAYAARRTDTKKAWQKIAYTEDASTVKAAEA